MASQLGRAVGRFQKLEVVYLIICLCLQFITDVSTTNNFPKNIQSSAQFKDSSHDMPNKSTKLSNYESGVKTLSRKSRAATEVDFSSMFSEDGKESEIMKDIFQEEESESFNSEWKRNKGASVIPSPRVGRSKVDPNLIMPYPDSWLIPYLSKTQNEMNEINAPVFVVDEDFENNSEYFSEESDNDESDAEEETILQDNEEYQFDSISERQADSNGTVIPYPRLGKRDVSSLKENKSKFNQNSPTRVKRATNSIIPQIRVGRSSQTDKLSKPMTQSLYILPNYRPGRSSNGFEKYLKYDKNTKPGILPYPRPGRSNGESVTRQHYILPQPRVGRSLIESKDIERMDMYLKLNPSRNDRLTEELLKSEESKLFLIPYPRPGKRFFGTKPLPPNVNLQYKNKDEFSSEDIGDKEQAVATFLVPYPRPGRSRNGKQYLMPNARFGKAVSDSMLPLPRYGRFSNKNPNIILPYPRPGRSISLIPNARFGRSDILPYPRPGRSYTSVLPYPRLGRATYSTSVIPQMRVGKSNSSVSMIPQMRVGKSTSSESMIPQMRVGKSASTYSVIPQIRVGKSVSSASIIPQIRVGKSVSSASIIPQMRVGKSASSLVIPQMRVGKSASSLVIPQMRVGKSSNSLLNDLSQEDEDPLPPDMSELSDLNFLDEQVKQLLESKIKLNNFQTDSSSNILKSAVLIPEKKLKKHMVTGGSDYMLPYPRPGRFV